MDSRDAGCVGTHQRYVPIDEELLRRLYVDERLTGREIARQLDCGEITILRRLRRFGIRARPRGRLHQAKTLNSDTRWSPNLSITTAGVKGDLTHSITAPFNAPSQGPPPWNVYRVEPRSAIVTLAAEPGGLTRFRF